MINVKIVFSLQKYNGIYGYIHISKLTKIITFKSFVFGDIGAINVICSVYIMDTIEHQTV